MAANDQTQPPKMTSKMVESTWASIGYFLFQLDPDIRKLIRRLKHLHFKILKKKQSVVINQTYSYIYIVSILSLVFGIK